MAVLAIACCEQFLPTTIPKPSTLEDGTFDLGNLLQVDVSDHDSPSNRQSHQTTAEGQKNDLDMSVGVLNRSACRTSNWVLGLIWEIGVDLVDVADRGGGEPLLELLVERVRPDRGTDGITRRATDRSDDVQQTERSSDVLVVDSSQDRQLLDEDEHRTAHRDKDLAHDLVAPAHVRLAEVDHQALGKDVEWDGDVQEPLEAAGLADNESDTDQEDAGDDVESVSDVSGLGDGEAVIHLQPGLEVVVPAVV